MTELVKVHRKDQLVKDFTSKCLFLILANFLYFSYIPDIDHFVQMSLENYNLRIR